MLWVISFLPLCIIAWILYTFIYSYLTETGTFWQRTLKACKDSATIVWAKLVIIAGLAVTQLDKIAVALGDPSLVTQFQQYLTPTTIGISGAIIMGLSIWARLRTLGK